LVAAGAGDIWVEKAGDEMSGTCFINANSNTVGGFPLTGLGPSYQISGNSTAGLFSVAPVMSCGAYAFTGGNVNAPAALTNNLTVFLYNVGGWDGAAYLNGGRFLFATSEAWTTTARGMRISFFTTTNGTTSVTERLRIADNGDVQMGGANTVIDTNRIHRLRQYTVATLPTVGTAGRLAAVTDATAPAYLTTVAGGGAVNTPVYDNGTNWVCG
jgi:hypothetical protein